MWIRKGEDETRKVDGGMNPLVMIVGKEEYLSFLSKLLGI